jgi:hypothetical protein
MTQETETGTVGIDSRTGEETPPDRSGWPAPLPERLPEPTVWPAVLAFGACLAAWGVVTSWVISIVGLVLFSAGIAGWIARMRHERAD